MALVQEYGKPDLFLTMTCNPSWPEIKELLGPGEEAQNRPDIVVRVFHAKLLALKKLIMEKHIFGKVAAFIYVVEFQKRGLPHAHMLIILKPPFKLNSPSDFDKFVSAEIPHSDNPRLRALVLKHMIHGPCGNFNPDYQCMKKKNSMGRCKYNYPKSFSTETTTNSDSYPEYRRRNDGQTTLVRKVLLNNRWVIPYNPYLLSLFDCHINVEVCSTIEAVKYLYKYVYKGHDTISFNVVSSGDPKPVDEIEQYQSGRWVSPCEAMWRIYGFDLFETQPPVMVLPVHLQNMQSLRLNPAENLEAVIANAKRARTPLTEFFSENCNEGAEQLSYEGERYFLRILLLHVRGPKSFEELRTINGQTYATFQEAALKRH
ncbi:uncharacterized protein LOC141607472 [Silene latifolia]|uniref:uncharacterized protein LOC141607472 n=1 Tax=Silene latifolia TaxID=37657 RepID=UPI003D781C39